MKLRAFKSEAEMATSVVAYLKEDGWTVYEEVVAGNTCDIVGVRGPVVMAVECKLAMNFEVINQAHQWIGRAHLSVVATPGVRGNRDVPIRNFLRTTGAGWIEVGTCGDCRMVVTPRFHRKLQPDRKPLRGFLHESQLNTASAGKAHCWRSTPFSRTVQEFQIIVFNNPGITMKAAMKLMSGKHHYHDDASARATLSQWLRKGVIEKVKWEKPAKDILLYPAVDFKGKTG